MSNYKSLSYSLGMLNKSTERTVVWMIQAKFFRMRTPSFLCSNYLIIRLGEESTLLCNLPTLLLPTAIFFKHYVTRLCIAWGSVSLSTFALNGCKYYCSNCWIIIALVGQEMWDGLYLISWKSIISLTPHHSHSMQLNRTTVRLVGFPLCGCFVHRPWQSIYNSCQLIRAPTDPDSGSNAVISCLSLP